MATSFDVVEDLGLTVIADYKIEKLFTQQGEEQFKAYCDIFLMNAINNFIKSKPLLPTPRT